MYDDRLLFVHGFSFSLYLVSETAIPEEGTMFNSPVFKILDFLLGIPIIHDIMFGVYRKQIVEKSEKMGLPWTEFMNEQWDSLPDLRNLADDLDNPKTKIPEYYYAPIHAYREGNLCWESAMEVGTSLIRNV